MNRLVAKRGGALLAAARDSSHHRARATSQYAGAFRVSTRARSIDATAGLIRSSTRFSCYYYDKPGYLMFKSLHTPYVLLVLAGLAFGSMGMGSSKTLAESEEKFSPIRGSKASVSENPLLSGVSERDIQAFVVQVLADPNINVKGIPDVLEAELYRMTVRLVLNMIYSSIGAMHGAEFLAGHRIELKRRRETVDEAATSRLFLKENSGIDEAILEQVADRLLQNSAINYTLVPDYVERQIYGNCLKLVFRLLDTLANTFCINICGHELRIYFDPIKTSMVDHLTAITPTKGLSIQSSKSRINVEVLTAQLSSNTNSPFQQQVLLSVYTLVLGIIDDVLANSEIKLLYDRVSFDVVAGSIISDDDDGDAVNQELLPTKARITTQTSMTPATSRQSGTVPIAFRGTAIATTSAIFAAGVALGAIATFFLDNRRR
jgi:hypothetical protein